jgi:hypothetical protein
MLEPHQDDDPNEPPRDGRLLVDEEEAVERRLLAELGEPGVVLHGGCRRILSRLCSRVARFILVQHTKKSKIYQIIMKNTKWPQNIPHGRKIEDIAIKYTNILHCKRPSKI